jgi:REP element-mobilizing transposase RayT
MELADELYHVTSRGDRREAIYRDDRNRADWLGVLGEVCARFNWRCRAYCEMINHRRFVAETPDPNCRTRSFQYPSHTGRRTGTL